MKPIYCKVGRTGGRSKRTEGVGASGSQVIQAEFLYVQGGNSCRACEVQMHVSGVTGKAVLVVNVEGQEPQQYEFEIR